MSASREYYSERGGRHYNQTKPHTPSRLMHESRAHSGVRSRSPPPSSASGSRFGLEAGVNQALGGSGGEGGAKSEQISEEELLALCAGLESGETKKESSAAARRARRQEIMNKYTDTESHSRKTEPFIQQELPKKPAGSKLEAAPAVVPTDVAGNGHESDSSEDMFCTSVQDDVAALAAAGVLAEADTTAAAVAKRSEEVESHAVTARAAAAGAGGEHLQDNFDDAEGFLRTRVGESLGGRYTVQGSTGRGVFGAVCFCIDNQPLKAPIAPTGLLNAPTAPTVPSSTSSLVAVKVLRANDTMRKAGEKEIETLQAIQKVDPHATGSVIRMLRWFEHHGHLCLVFEPMHMNLKEVQDKFGRGVGIAIDAVALYTRQLLQGLRTVHKAGFIHADIKPQNILANETFNVVKVADLGSAFGERSADNVATPILVSRFYRAPEIIMGLLHSPALDVWALACVLYEMYTGDILFQGEDNNDMLHRVQCLRGRFPNKLVRKHLAAVSALEIESHFDDENRFVHLEVDPVTKAKVARHVVVPIKPEVSLQDRLFAQRASTDSQKQVMQFKDLLERMLVADPARRIKVHEALKHPFVATQ